MRLGGEEWGRIVVASCKRGRNFCILNPPPPSSPFLVHHKSKITIGISSAYFHPVDYVFSAIAVVLPPLLVSNHVLTSYLWMTVFMLETTNAHCGYEIPFMPSAKDHDFHHSHSFYSSKEYRFVTMGAFALVWDRIFGTKKPVDDWWEKHPNGITKKMKAPVEKDGKKTD